MGLIYFLAATAVFAVLMAIYFTKIYKEDKSYKR